MAPFRRSFITFLSPVQHSKQRHESTITGIFFDEGNQTQTLKRTKDNMTTTTTADIYVIVTAHPDDESMFFLPTIRCLQKQGCDLRLICLTTGSYDGLGKTRSREFVQTCRDILGIEQFQMVDDPKLPDHPTQSWPLDYAVSVLERYLRQIALPQQQIHVITFDSYGVSGHINHRDTFRATQALFHTAEPSFQFWTLKSVRNPIIKYFPLYSWCSVLLHWIRILPAVQSNANEAHVYRLHTSCCIGSIYCQRSSRTPHTSTDCTRPA